MLKVNNKKVIQDLAKTTYKANKKRNLLTIVAIFLTTFLLCTVISVGLSYWDTVSLRQQRMQGIDYDIELTEPRDDQVSTIRKMDNVRYAGLSVKCGIALKYQDKELDKIKFYWLDDTCWKQQTIPALDYYEGNYPVKENEIMLSQSALRSMGIENPKVGMELPFIYQTLAENSENNDTAKTFILSGWFLDYTGVDKGYVSDKFYQSTGVLQTDLTEGSLKISLKNPLYSEKDIMEMQNQINLSGNQIIEADYDTISNFIKTMMGLLILLVLVFMSGYLFIYNTLYISVNRDIRYFGQLKTIGTTSVQIRKMIYKQMLWNAMIGIPLGLVCSSIVGKIIIPQLLHSLNPTIAISEVGTISLWVFIIATIFSLTTTMISSQKPVKIAMNCSPIEAMKYIGATSVKNKNKKRTGGDIGSMVKMNLFRDKKQFVVIMCSLSLAVSLFLIINVVIYANNAKNILNHFDEIMGQPLIEMIKIDYDEPFSKNVESSIKSIVANNKLISAESKLDSYLEMKNSENQITVLGGSLGIIIMLLAVSNYLNMMSESIQNRSKEFAILESVGMTRKQIKKMIVFESLGYSILSIVIALIIGLPACYYVFTNFNIYGIPFVFPVIKTLLLFIAIIIVCVVTSLFVFSKSKSETIIELLRKDEA